MTTFRQFVMKIAKRTDDACGDLVGDLRDDSSNWKNFTSAEGLKSFLRRRHACGGAIEAADKLFARYRKHDMPRTPIQDMIDAMKADSSAASHRPFERRAVAAFAALNDWTETERCFCLHKLSGDKFNAMSCGGRSSCRSVQAFPDVFDHPHWFKRGKKPAAIVAQPYGDIRHDVERLRAIPGIKVTIPPSPLASPYFPGSAYFVVVTGENEWPVFLPEQNDVNFLAERNREREKREDETEDRRLAREFDSWESV